MKVKVFLTKYLIDARSFEEKHNRSMALAYERLLKGKTGQATRLFAYNHALNQQAAKPVVPVKNGPWKVRVWKNNKVIKTLTVENDKEFDIKPKIKALGMDWDRATIHDPKTMKTLSKFYNK